MTPGLASPRALLPNAPVLLPLTRRLAPSSQNREPRPKSEWCCRRRLLSPPKNEPLSFGRFVPGLPARGCDGGVHPWSLPAGWAHGRTQREGRMRPPGQPRAGRQHVPQLPGVPGKAAGCRCPAPGRGGPSLAEPAATGEGSSQRGGQRWREVLATNRLHARKDRKKSSRFHNPKQQVWCQAPLWERFCALRKAVTKGDENKQVRAEAGSFASGSRPERPRPGRSPRRGQSSAPRGLLALRQRGGEGTGSALPILELLPRADCPLRSEGD